MQVEGYSICIIVAGSAQNLRAHETSKLLCHIVLLSGRQTAMGASDRQWEGIWPDLTLMGQCQKKLHELVKEL